VFRRRRVAREGVAYEPPGAIKADAVWLAIAKAVAVAAAKRRGQDSRLMVVTDF
jgi:hypothetical protein